MASGMVDYECKILLYKGVSLVSKAIQFQTRSEYSHAAIQMPDKTVIEAWHVGGVRRLRTAFDGHSDGTFIDIYRLDRPDDCDWDSVNWFLIAQIGKSYDFKSVARFLSRRKVQADEKWFCSELVLAALKRGGIQLLNLAPSLASPRDVGVSPRLIYEKTIFN